MTIALVGTGVSKGIAIGKARVLRDDDLEITEYALPASLIDEEVARFERALESTAQQLRAIRDRIPSETPEDIAAFIDTHLLMLGDSALSSAPIEIIRSRRCNAEWALKLQQDALVKIFDQMDDAYLKTRRDDVEHVVKRIQHTLLTEGRGAEIRDQQRDIARILLAEDLSPGDILLMHQHDVAAIVTEHGAPMSHTAILARGLGIPAVVGLKRARDFVRDEETVIIDGRNGVLLTDVDERTIAFYQKERRSDQRAQAQLSKLKSRPAVTRDGVPITLRANIELPDDLNALKRVGAEGVGLYRTEFLYLNQPAPPDEEAQLRIYRRVLKRLAGAPLTIRTLDLGADKQPTAAGGIGGPNPALGLRAIRYCLKELPLFRTQLRAILRASAYGPVRLLVPMLTNLSEVIQVRQLVDELQRELLHRNIPCAAKIPIGGMIEIPAAALCAEQLARQLDFLSIGTNDLIQYTLATDRIDDEVNYLFDPLNPGVLRLIAMTLEAGRTTGTPVAMCGEMAGDPQYTRLLLGMGLTEFSAPPSTLLEVKRIVTESEMAALRRKVAPLIDAAEPQDLVGALEALNLEAAVPP